MTRCGFCGLSEGLNDLDDIYSHQMTITPQGISLCSFIDRIDSQIWENDILPARVAGFKYAPKNHDGIKIYYNNEGKLINKTLVGMLLGTRT